MKKFFIFLNLNVSEFLFFTSFAWGKLEGERGKRSESPLMLITFLSLPSLQMRGEVLKYQLIANIWASNFWDEANFVKRCFVIWRGWNEVMTLHWIGIYFGGVLDFKIISTTTSAGTHGHTPFNDPHSRTFRESWNCFLPSLSVKM